MSGSIKNYIKAKNSGEETLPFTLVEKLVSGEESKIKIMRQYRGLSIGELAKRIEITEVYLSQLEHHKRKGTIEVYKRLAKALDIDIEVIV